MESLHQKTLSELKTITQRLDDISTKCEDIKEYIDCAKDYSYQFNVKIMGLPVMSESKSAEVTKNLCLRHFKHIGVKDISLMDIDIPHRVSPRRPSNRPNPVVCRFVRRLAKNLVMACRKSVSKVTALQNAQDVKAVAEECLDVISECGLAIILTVSYAMCVCVDVSSLHR